MGLRNTVVAEESEPMKSWLKKRSRIYWYDQYALNEQVTAFARYDPDRIANELADVGADIVALYAANQFGIAYYPSQIWPPHPNLKGRDYFGEIHERLRNRGIKTLAYVNWLDSKHADWMMIPPGAEAGTLPRELPLVSWAKPLLPNGRVQAVPGGKWQWACPLSTQRKQIAAVAREVMERYHPDAFHMDMFHGLPMCLCPRCRAVLEPMFGVRTITPEVLETHWREYLNWRCDCSAEVIAEITAVVHQYGAVAAHNSGVPFLPVVNGFDRGWLKSLDVFLSEAFEAFLLYPTDLNATSVVIRLQHAIGKPAWILRTSTSLSYAHWPITPAEWQLYAASCKANGCAAFGPCGVGAYPDTTSPRRLLANVKAAFDFYMQDADLAEGAVSAARVGLVFSWATRKYFARQVASGQMEWTEEFMGWARFLIEEHVPYDVVIAENIAEGQDLSGYDLLVLPNAANVSDAFCDVIRRYVRQGGRILVTAGTSLRDEQGADRQNYALGDVLGIAHCGQRKGSFAYSGREEPEPASGDLYEVACAGEPLVYRVELDPAGSVVGSALDPLPGVTTTQPVAMMHKFEKGAALYIAFDIGCFYTRHGDAHIGDFMRAMLDRIGPIRQVDVKGPRTVEVTLWHQPARRRVILHLANRTVPWTLPTQQRQITEIIPVYELELSMENPFAKTVVSSRGAKIRIHKKGKRLGITVLKLDAYAAITMDEG